MSEYRERHYEAELLDDPKEPRDFKGDKVGTGRYIICFLLASFIGLWVAYWARYYGWRCVWISLILKGLLIALIIYSVVSAPDCYIDAYGREVCAYD